MRRFKRRRSRVQWLPNTGTAIDNGLNAIDQGAFALSLGTINFSAGNPTTVVEIPLVLDNPSEADEVATGLAVRQTRALDEEQSFGYKLRRVVGSLFVGVRAASSTTGTVPSAVLVQAGLIIRRVDSNGLSLAGSVSIGDINPGSLANNEDPWIWRRDWLLGPINKLLNAGSSELLPAPDATDPFNLWANVLPETNHFTTGPNGTSTLDTKIARRVGKEERLFLDVAFTTLASVSAQTPLNQAIGHYIVFPYRVLATVTSQYGNRRNASR